MAHHQDLDHRSSPPPRRRPARGARLLTSLLLALCCSVPCGPAIANPPSQPSTHAYHRLPAPSTQAFRTRAPSTSSSSWMEVLLRLWDRWTGTDHDPSVAQDGITSGTTDPDGVEPEDGDSAGTGTDPLNPQPDPPEEPKDERGSVIDPNGSVPQ